MLGDKIKHLRTTAKLTQEAFAEKLGVSQQAIGLWERNKNLPNQKLLIKIAQFFNVTLDYLFDEHINTNKIIYTPDEVQLIEKFRLLNQSDQKIILKNIEFLVEQQNQQYQEYKAMQEAEEKLKQIISNTYPTIEARKTLDFMEFAFQYGKEKGLFELNEVESIYYRISLSIEYDSNAFFKNFIENGPTKETIEYFFNTMKDNISKKKLKTG